MYGGNRYSKEIITFGIDGGIKCVIHIDSLKNSVLVEYCSGMGSLRIKQETWSIFNRLVLLFGYGGHLEIVVKSPLKKALFTLQGLQTSENKTKYMRDGGVGGQEVCLEMGPYKFVQIEHFIYLGSKLNTENNISWEIREWITDFTNLKAW